VKGRVVAKRYSGALFELSLDRGSLERVSSEVQAIGELAKKLPLFIKGLSDERVDTARRVSVADMIARAAGLSEETSNALKLLVEKGRVSLLPFLASDFELRVRQHAKLVQAEAKVAQGEMADEIKRRIEKMLSELVKMDARCEVCVDAELLGGFSLSVGDSRYDASLRGKFERMKEDLV